MRHHDKKYCQTTWMKNDTALLADTGDSYLPRFKGRYNFRNNRPLDVNIIASRSTGRVQLRYRDLNFSAEQKITVDRENETKKQICYRLSNVTCLLFERVFLTRIPWPICRFQFENEEYRGETRSELLNQKVVWKIEAPCFDRVKLTLL